MKTLKGTVKKSNIEGGIWTLESGGKTYELKDGPPDLYQDGMKATVKGHVKKNLMGIGMSGPIFEVKEAKM